jgi:hypothetical protein
LARHWPRTSLACIVDKIGRSDACRQLAGIIPVFPVSRDLCAAERNHGHPRLWRLAPAARDSNRFSLIVVLAR